MAHLSGKHVLAIRAGALGDTIVALPALEILREALGEGHLAFAGREPACHLALAPGYASSVHPLERGPLKDLYRVPGPDESLDELERFLSPFDKVVSWTRAAGLATLAEKLGFELSEHLPAPPDGVHASEHLVRSLASFGLVAEAPLPRLSFAKDEFSRARTLVQPERQESQALVPLTRDSRARALLQAGKYLALHPGSGDFKKNAPGATFQALALRAKSEGLDVLWIEGEADREATAGLRAAVPAPVAHSLPLPALGSLLSRAFAYVGNDSGVSHLAAASGAKTVTLFGPTDPRQWAPRGPLVRIRPFDIGATAIWDLVVTLS